MKRLEQVLSENMNRYRVKNLNEVEQLDIQFNATPETDTKKMGMLIRQMFQGKSEQEIEAYIKTKPPGWLKKLMNFLKNLGIKGKDGEKHGGPVIGLAGLVGTILSFLKKPEEQ